MKKKKIKSLGLNKKSISRLQQDHIIGGATVGTFCSFLSNLIECPSATCITTADSGGVAKPSCGNCDK